MRKSHLYNKNNWEVYTHSTVDRQYELDEGFAFLPRPTYKPKFKCYVCGKSTLIDGVALKKYGGLAFICIEGDCRRKLHDIQIRSS